MNNPFESIVELYTEAEATARMKELRCMRSCPD